MTEPTRPSLDVDVDVDALARRLPRRTLPGDRSRAMRGALLDTAEPAPRRQPHGPSRWALGSAAVAVATTAAAVVLVLRGEPPPATTRSASDPTGSAHAMAAERATPLPAPDRAITPPAFTAPSPSAWSAPVPAPGDPPDDRRATGRAIATPPADDTTSPRAGSAPLRPGAASPSRTTAAVHATTAAPSSALPPPHETAPAAVTARLPDALPDAPGSAAPPAAGGGAPGPEATAERAFRDGLQALLSGDARAARAPLDRACAALSSSREDSCYWAAVAWLRSGDRAHALRGFADLLARWPGSTHAGEASVALGWLLLDSGDRAAAHARFAAAAGDPMPSVRAEARRGLAAVP